MTNRTFPTSEELYKRIKTDPNISSCHVAIVYFDSILNKYIDKRFASWKDIDKGGDIPWHRVYYFKYKDKIIWDRQKKQCSLEDIISAQNNLEQSFKIVSYNILNDYNNIDKSPETVDRTSQILDYIISTNADIICLQEVTNPVIEALKRLTNYEMAVTDLKTNNIVFLSKHKIHDVTLVNLNNSRKQAIKIVVRDHNDIDIQFIGLHLTSDHQNKAEDKRKEQIAIIKNMINNNPVFIMGDFNVENDNIPDLDKQFTDVTNIVNDKTYTFDPSLNELALINCKTKTPKRYDRIYFNRNFNVVNYLVRTDVMSSDHFPVECTIDSSNDLKIIGEHKGTSMMLIIKNDAIDRIRCKHDPGYDKYPAHLNIYYGFVERDEFDMAFYKIYDMIEKKYLGSKLVFDKLDVLDLDKHKVLCLLPSDETKNLLMNLRADIDDLLQFKQTPFTPHISLGKWTTDTDEWKTLNQ